LPPNRSEIVAARAGDGPLAVSPVCPRRQVGSAPDRHRCHSQPALWPSTRTKSLDPPRRLRPDAAPLLLARPRPARLPSQDRELLPCAESSNRRSGRQPRIPTHAPTSCAPSRLPCHCYSHHRHSTLSVVRCQSSVISHLSSDLRPAFAEPTAGRPLLRQACLRRAYGRQAFHRRSSSYGGQVGGQASDL
jgi:hypothetical protein